MDMLHNKIINNIPPKHTEHKKLLPKMVPTTVVMTVAAEKTFFGGKNGSVPVFSPAERAKECYMS